MTETAPSPDVATTDVLTLCSPAEVLATVPYMLGFQPADSVVLISLRGPRQRVGLTLRADLPQAGTTPLMAEECAGHLCRDGASAAIAVLYGSPQEALWPALRAALDALQIPVREALRVDRGRWWSYLCLEPTCCPPEGTPVLRPSDPGGPVRVGAHMVAAGAAVLDSRQALADWIAPADPATLSAVENRLAAVTEEALRRSVRGGGVSGCRRLWRRQVAAALRRCRQTSPPSWKDDEVAALLVALADVPTRDLAAGWVRTDHGQRSAEAAGAGDPAVQQLWAELTRRAPRPYDVAPASLLAHAAWLSGHGALARVAVDRALRSDPTYRLALLLQRLLDRGVGPSTPRRSQPRASRRGS